MFNNNQFVFRSEQIRLNGLLSPEELLDIIYSDVKMFKEGKAWDVRYGTISELDGKQYIPLVQGSPEEKILIIRVIFYEQGQGFCTAVRVCNENLNSIVKIYECLPIYLNNSQNIVEVYNSYHRGYSVFDAFLEIFVKTNGFVSTLSPKELPDLKSEFEKIITNNEFFVQKSEIHHNSNVFSNIDYVSVLDKYYKTTQTIFNVLINKHLISLKMKMNAGLISNNDYQQKVDAIKKIEEESSEYFADRMSHK
jgi:hypothetical protein